MVTTAPFSMGWLCLDIFAFERIKPKTERPLRDSALYVTPNRFLGSDSHYVVSVFTQWPGV